MYCIEMREVQAPAGGSRPWVRIQVLAILTEVSVSVGFPLDFVISEYFSGNWSYILSQMKKISSYLKYRTNSLKNLLKEENFHW